MSSGTDSSPPCLLQTVEDVSKRITVLIIYASYLTSAGSSTHTNTPVIMIWCLWDIILETCYLCALCVCVRKNPVKSRIEHRITSAWYRLTVHTRCIALANRTAFFIAAVNSKRIAKGGKVRKPLARDNSQLLANRFLASCRWRQSENCCAHASNEMAYSGQYTTSLYSQ